MMNKIQMKNFLVRLMGPDGCDIRTDPNTKELIVGRCENFDQNISRRILTDMQIPQDEIDYILDFALNHGIMCDCRIATDFGLEMMNLASQPTGPTKVYVVIAGGTMQECWSNKDVTVETLNMDELSTLEYLVTTDPDMSTIEQKELTRYRNLKEKIEQGKLDGTLEDVGGL